METQNSSVENAEILNNNGENTQGVQAPTIEELTAKLAQEEADKKALQAEYTRNRQYLIDVAMEQAKANPKSIATIKDEKLQSTIVRQLYNVDNYAQLVAIYGENFDNNNEQSPDEELKRKVKVLEFNAQKSEVEQAIREYKLSNPELFADAGNEEKLREELRYISGDLPPADRISRAARVAFSNPTNPTALAYQVLNT